MGRVRRPTTCRPHRRTRRRKHRLDAPSKRFWRDMPRAVRHASERARNLAFVGSKAPGGEPVAQGPEPELLFGPDVTAKSAAELARIYSRPCLQVTAGLGLCTSLLEAVEFRVKDKDVFTNGHAEIEQVTRIFFLHLLRCCVRSKVSALPESLTPIEYSIVNNAVIL